MAMAVSAPPVPEAQMRSIDSSVSAASARSRSRRSSITSSMTTGWVSFAWASVSVCTGDSLGRRQPGSQIEPPVGSRPVLGAMATVEGDRIGSMFLFFLIALVIVSPFGYRRIRAVLRERRALVAPSGGTEARASDDPARGDAGGGLHPDDVATVVREIDTAAAELVADPAGSRTIDVPDEPLMGGRPAPGAVVEALLADAVRRSGLRSEWIDDGGRRRLRVERPS